MTSTRASTAKQPTSSSSSRSPETHSSKEKDKHPHTPPPPPAILSETSLSASTSKTKLGEKDESQWLNKPLSSPEFLNIQDLQEMDPLPAHHHHEHYESPATTVYIDSKTKIPVRDRNELFAAVGHGINPEYQPALREEDVGNEEDDTEEEE